MTEAEEQQLRDLGEEIAGAMSSPWEPSCIARVFSTPRSGEIALTMQGWIDLDRARSPLLVGEPLMEPEALAAAAEVFGLDFEGMLAEEIAHCALAMERAVQEAFAMALPMREPGAIGSAAPDGFGVWLPVFSFLVAQCHIPPEVAMVMRVDQAFALMAGVRRNQGWEVAGTAYALRDVEDTTNE